MSQGQLILHSRMERGVTKKSCRRKKKEEGHNNRGLPSPKTLLYYTITHPGLLLVIMFTSTEIGEEANTGWCQGTMELKR